MSFPVTLLISGKPCVVIGGGVEASERAEALLAAGAAVTVIAAEPDETLRRLARDRRLRLLEREFRPADVAGAFVVFNTVRDASDLGVELLRLAEARRFLLSSLDQPEFSNFTMPAVVRRGRLRVAISTGGASPALARRLRQDLEQLLTPEFADFLDWLGARRREIRDAEPDPARRTDRLRASLDGFRLGGAVEYPAEWRRLKKVGR